MRPYQGGLLALLLCLPATGCCSLAQGLTALFCGPRKDPRVVVSWRTPEETLATFQAAIGRDDVTTIYESLSAGLKERWALDALNTELAWQEIKKRVPGIHVVDQAQVEGKPEKTSTTANYQLVVAFQRFRITLVRQDYWRVFAWVPGTGEDRLKEFGAVVPLLAPYLLVGPGPGPRLMTVKVRPDEHGVRLEDVVEVSVGREWKVDHFEEMAKK